MTRETISKIKNEKSCSIMGCNTRNVKVAGEAGVDMIIDLLNQIRALGVILAEWELATIVNCYNGKGDALE